MEKLRIAVSSQFLPVHPEVGRVNPGRGKHAHMLSDLGLVFNVICFQLWYIKNIYQQPGVFSESER